MKLIIEQIKNGITVKVESSQDDKAARMAEGMQVYLQQMMAYFKQKEEYSSDPELYKAVHGDSEPEQSISMDGLAALMAGDKNDRTFYFNTMEEIITFLQKFSIPEVAQPA